MDWIVQKISELGATRLVPLFTQRCDVHLTQLQCQKRLQHWQMVAIGAAEQAGRNQPLIIEPPVTFSAFTENCRHLQYVNVPNIDMIDAAMLMLHPMSLVNETMNVVCPLKTWLTKPNTIRNITLLVGPEGGWSPEEVTAILSLGAKIVHLGTRILRTETAGLAMIAILQAMLGDLA